MPQARLESLRRLRREDDRSEFESGAPELDDWLRRYAWQNQLASNAVTYVTTVGERVVGYYALAAAAVSRDEAPSEFARWRPRGIPCILLARLAVDRRVQGRGVGAALLADAIGRSVAASEAFGAAGLLVHCRDEVAREFCLRLADFAESPSDPLHLVLPMAAARAIADGER